jgi:hypothetical protein
LVVQFVLLARIVSLQPNQPIRLILATQTTDRNLSSTELVPSSDAAYNQVAYQGRPTRIDRLLADPPDEFPPEHDACFRSVSRLRFAK